MEAAAPGEQLTLPGFSVALGNFEGPFDLLLQLIGAKKLDVTEIALSEVTDEFIAYTRHLGEQSSLDEVTEFLVIAATLLDVKTARLLPRGEVDDEEDLALLESRDILFAKLLQYQAYKKAAELFGRWQTQAQRRYPRAVSLEPRFADLLPPVQLGMDKDQFAQFAASVFRPKPPEEVATGHIHQVAVSVPEQAGKLLDALRLAGADTWVAFGRLTSDCRLNMEVVGRFLALLELFKARAVSLDQPEPLGDLAVSWTGVDVDPAVVAAANWQ
ncbi:segregation and condensation protein A [Corynebacterium aquilae DSM 44791]|uniref:Segregation and condensation protein A n=1 Tax=Corynebacterium aquilae DSM 44791 TaxID=1431546 RepID=A0A1L7CFR8_9CORY|nr:segregation and condensation protein A [Corynebacterium aquilae DSM 44791]